METALFNLLPDRPGQPLKAKASRYTRCKRATRGLGLAFCVVVAACGDPQEQGAVHFAQALAFFQEGNLPKVRLEQYNTLEINQNNS